MPPKHRGQNAFTPTASLLTTVSQETKDDLNKVDGQLHEVLGLTIGMEAKARAMDEEIIRQNEVLDRIEDKVDEHTDTLQSHNKRIGKLNEKY